MVYARDSKSRLARDEGSSPSSGTHMKQKVLIILGPTASGKSGLGVAIARTFKGEIISADSRQVYKGLDIGTGKITKKEMRGVPHYLLDVASPKKQFSADDFKRAGLRAIDTIAKRGKLPIIVGGTGFYIDALLGRMPLPEVPPNPALRARLEKKSAPQLYAMLQKKDPRRAKTLATQSERNNKTRLVRALEIAAALGVVPKPARLNLAGFDVLWVGIAPKQEELDKKIRLRLFARIRAGMVAEARRLRAAGLSYKRMRELGLEYRALADMLEKKISKEEFQESLYREIRRYSRRQITYWKRNKEIRWFDPKDKKKIESSIRAWLRK